MPFKNTYRTFDDVECGLVSIHDGFVLPLHLSKCEVDVEVINHIGHYIVRQTYENLTDDTLEATYIFPIQEGGAVHYFTAESDGVVIKGVVQEKSESAGTANYDEDELAMGDNRTSFLLTDFKPDLYQLALGELAANSITTVELKYVCELPLENNAVKLTLPNTVAPQYTKPAHDCTEKTTAEQLVDLDKELEVPINFKIRQTVAFKVECDPQEMKFGDGHGLDEDGFYYSTGTLKLQRTTFEEEQIIFVSTVTGKPFGARILIEETSKGEVAGMVTVVPEFKPVDYQSDMIFLVDRSGSMTGRSIEKAKEALHIFLASLPGDCTFNICSFNASFDFCFETSKPYTDENLAAARRYTDNLQAGGGTRVYEPLEQIFKIALESDSRRQIFVLTDGHVSRPQQSVDMVSKNTNNGRVFSLGIGSDASRVLVNGLATAGNGTALFVTLAEDLKDKVLELLSRSLLPGLSNIKLDWLSDLVPQKSFLSMFKSKDDVANIGKTMSLKEPSAPSPIPHGFASELTVVYQSLEFGNLPVGLRITGKGPEGDVMLIINLDSTKVMKCELLHKLMARRMVKMLEEDDKFGEDVNVQKRMISLGKSYNITNKYCASVSTGQFGKKEAAKKSSGSVGSSDGSGQEIFRAAPQGLVRPASPPNLAHSGFIGGGGMKKKGKKKGGGGSGFAMKSAMSPSAPMQQQRMQVSNTRWAKSKHMSSMPAKSSGGVGASRNSGGFMKMKMPTFRSEPKQAQVQFMNASPPPPPPIQQQEQMQDLSIFSNNNMVQQNEVMDEQVQVQQMMGDMSSGSGSELEELMEAVAQPSLTTGQIRDDMLMGFTVLQKTDGSFSYGPAFHKDLNIKETDFDEGAKNLNIPKDLLMTLVVLIYLRSVMANRKSSWNRIGIKADEFIARNIAGLDLIKLEESVQKFMDKFINQSRSSVLFKGYKKRAPAPRPRSRSASPPCQEEE